MTRTEPVLMAVSPHAVSHAGVLDTFAVLKAVILPTLGKGPLIRRRKVVGYAERKGLDDRAVKRLQALRRKHGAGPLVLAVPFRRQALLLSPADVRMVLEGSPDPFDAATREKRSALNHFEPHVVLASKGADREKRRRLNEETLETGCPIHSMSERFAKVVAEEMDAVCDQALEQGVLDWDSFFTGWMRTVRRIVLGDDARDDTELTDLLEDLRYRANYAFLRPRHRKGREAFLRSLRRYVDKADPQSLAGRMAQLCPEAGLQPHHQLPQYLFAFDPGGMALFRTLALLSAHSAAEEKARAEIAAAEGKAVPSLDYLRACFLEALRLWPTTPAILRETTRPVRWARGGLDEDVHIFIFAPFFHRDDETLDQAHVFDPALWTDGIVRPDLALVPFSHGPVVCPAAHFVPMTASLALRRLLTRMTMNLEEPERLSPRRLPGTLDNYTLRFLVTAK
ncbi:cytochrome P450 [Brevundimonas sp.]|uniref:cytochrome P450 n=1 Tax=Brevundimonas sp. TaxID=1871086 RepID=UPI001D22398E|nr:cytochrome P450 [Brevundimonas sp.]MBA3999471.1 cytochrome P450 [Brevundimonas sp.]